LDIPEVKDRLQFAIEVYANGRTQCSKNECFWFLKLMNSTCFFCGDRNLAETQVGDLVDSIYTMSGRIDGQIPFDELFSLFIGHPLLEMFMSLQFQGIKQLAT
jgi:hypothetical protein